MAGMNLCRFSKPGENNLVRIGLAISDAALVDLTPAGITQLQPILESSDPATLLKKIDTGKLPRLGLDQVRFCAPVEGQEVWAAGVTYLRSKSARMDESEFSASAYDLVYAAERPELFFKAVPQKVVATGEPVGIRKDARWSVPEPELALVINSEGRIAGYTVGNDMSSRDIEGENLLYLPQAKIYNKSCALGPWIAVGATESDARLWQIKIEIRRNKQAVFNGETSVSQINRRFEDLAEYLFRSQAFPHGAVLLTGTGVVPPDTFTLEENDEVEIEITGIGRLRNPVVRV
jgi:2-dehydro-3-deoxy-D-arabinonate dehydratase